MPHCHCITTLAPIELSPQLTNRTLFAYLQPFRRLIMTTHDTLGRALLIGLVGFIRPHVSAHAAATGGPRPLTFHNRMVLNFR